MIVDTGAPAKDVSEHRWVALGMFVVLVVLLVGFASLIRRNNARRVRLCLIVSRLVPV